MFKVIYYCSFCDFESYVAFDVELHQLKHLDKEVL